MKVLILGAGGQLGRALVATAPPKIEIRALSRAQCDIASERQVRRAIFDIKPDVVFNAAAYTAVDAAENDVERARLVNSLAPGYAAGAAHEIGARTVHISTDFVFDGQGPRPKSPLDHPEPLNVYGRTKLDGERAAMSADPNVLIVRTAWLYAPQGSNFVNTMIRLMQERDRVDVVTDQIGTPTHAKSLARALWLFLDHGAKGIFHYTDSGVASWYDFAVAIAEDAAALGILRAPAIIKPVSTADYPTPARRPVFGLLDKSTSWDLLGTPASHWRENLRINLKELIS